MSKWNDTDIPLGYLITFRTYGTWLPGDERVRAQGIMWLSARWGGAFGRRARWYATSTGCGTWEKVG